MAMSLIAFSGAAQFAVIGYLAAGISWPLIAVLTFLLNARHVLYSAALAPWFRGRPFRERAVAAHLLTDESFALSIAHFRRVGRFDGIGYWYPAVVTTLIPWNIATFAGVTLGAAIVDPTALGIDVIFPAAMAGLAVGLISGRRELAAAVAGGLIAAGASLLVSPTVGVIAGGIVGPFVGLALPGRPAGPSLEPVP
jgi:predicted branched-subunit amino acid permease